MTKQQKHTLWWLATVLTLIEIAAVLTGHYSRPVIAVVLLAELLVSAYEYGATQ